MNILSKEKELIEAHLETTFPGFSADKFRINDLSLTYREHAYFGTLFEHFEPYFVHEHHHLVGVWQYPNQEPMALLLEDEGGLFLFENLISAMAAADLEDKTIGEFGKNHKLNISKELTRYSFDGVHPEVFLEGEDRYQILMTEKEIIDQHLATVLPQFTAEQGELQASLSVLGNAFEIVLEWIAMLYKHEDNHFVGIWKFPHQKPNALLLDNKGNFTLFDNLASAVDAILLENKKNGGVGYEEWTRFLSRQNWTISGGLRSRSVHPQQVLHQTGNKDSESL